MRDIASLNRTEGADLVTNLETSEKRKVPCRRPLPTKAERFAAGLMNGTNQSGLDLSDRKGVEDGEVGNVLLKYSKHLADW